MRKLFRLLVPAVFTLGFTTGTLAVPPGMTLDWEGGGMGKVVFSGQVHGDAGLQCADCHSGIFEQKKGAATIKMADIYAGKYCGACHDGKEHNGKEVFSAQAECLRCHGQP